MDCGCLSKRKSLTGSLTKDDDSIALFNEKQQKHLCKRILIWSCVALLVSLLIAFLIIWVIVPVSFMLSIDFQTFMVFMPVNSPRNVNFSQPEDLGIQGVHNFYITTRDVNDPNTTTDIGIWLILPEEDINITTSTNVTEIIQNTQHDIAIYLHGVFSNRAKALAQYRVLRKHFLIIAVDHRGYGDSGLNVPLTEAGIDYDHLQIYNWVTLINPTNDVYYWGHSLGSGMTTGTVKLIKEQGRKVPTGVVLESSFTSFEDIVLNIVFGRLYSWLAYFDSTILRPLDINGFHFRSRENVLSIDCPIMILHAEDDGIVPFILGERLAQEANATRNNDQGSVTFHRFAAEYGFGHNDITQYSEIGLMIDDFKVNCRNFSSFR